MSGGSIDEICKFQPYTTRSRPSELWECYSPILPARRTYTTRPRSVVFHRQCYSGFLRVSVSLRAVVRVLCCYLESCAAFSAQAQKTPVSTRRREKFATLFGLYFKPILLSSCTHWVPVGCKNTGGGRGLCHSLCWRFRCNDVRLISSHVLSITGLKRIYFHLVVDLS